MHASAECMLYEDTESTILLRRTQTPDLLQPRDPPWPWLTLNAARRSFQHGGLPQRQRCIECINTSVACFYSPNRGNQRHEILQMHQHFGGLHLLSSSNSGNKQREIQRAHTRETCAPCDSDVDVCSPSCRGNFNKTTSCTWPTTSSTCATTSSCLGRCRHPQRR